MSSTKRPRPATSGASSRRRRGCPIQLKGPRVSGRERSARGPVGDQLEEVAVGVEEVETLVVTPVDRGVMRDRPVGEEPSRTLVVRPRDLEGVMALAKRALD